MPPTLIPPVGITIAPMPEFCCVDPALALANSVPPTIIPALTAAPPATVKAAVVEFVASRALFTLAVPCRNRISLLT